VYADSACASYSYTKSGEREERERGEERRGEERREEIVGRMAYYEYTYTRT
jgi:hypothetical protein